MTTDEQLKELLSGNRRNKNEVPASLRWVEVLSVDADEKTMDARGVVDETGYHDIQLGSGSVVLYPAPGTICLIGIVEGMETNGFLISAEQVQKIELTASTEIILNGGTSGGLVKVRELTDRLNAFIDVFNKHTHQVTTTGSASAQSGTAMAPAGKAEKVNREDIENEKVKQ